MVKESSNTLFTGIFDGVVNRKKETSTVKLPGNFTKRMFSAGIKSLAVEYPDSYENWDGEILVSTMQGLKDEILDNSTTADRKTRVIELAANPQTINDHSGRNPVVLKIPNSLLEAAGIDKDVTFFGFDKRFTIAPREKKDALLAEAEAEKNRVFNANTNFYNPEKS